MALFDWRFYFHCRSSADWGEGGGLNWQKEGDDDLECFDATVHCSFCLISMITVCFLSGEVVTRFSHGECVPFSGSESLPDSHCIGFDSQETTE